MAAPRTWRPADEPVTTPSVPNEASPAPLSRRRFSMRQLPLSSAPARYMYVESMAMAWPELLVERPVTTPFVPKPDTPAPLSRRRFSIRQSGLSSYPTTYIYVESIAMANGLLLVDEPVTTPLTPKLDTPAPLSRRRFSIRQSLVTVPPSYPARYMYVESITIG